MKTWLLGISGLCVGLWISFILTTNEQDRRLEALKGQIDSLGIELAKNTFIFVDVTRDTATFASRGNILARLDSLEGQVNILVATPRILLNGNSVLWYYKEDTLAQARLDSLKAAFGIPLPSGGIMHTRDFRLHPVPLDSILARLDSLEKAWDTFLWNQNERNGTFIDYLNSRAINQAREQLTPRIHDLEVQVKTILKIFEPHPIRPEDLQLPFQTDSSIIDYDQPRDPRDEIKDEPGIMNLEAK